MTIVDIAKKAGVSIGTVDRVLHDRGRVSEDTKQRVLKIVHENGYRPNQMARNLKTGKTLTIGVLIPVLASEYGYWQTIKNGMDEAFDEISGFPVSIVYREFDRNRQNDLYEQGKSLIEENELDVLALPPIDRNQASRLIGEIKIPYVFFDSPLKDSSPIIQILQDPYKAGRCAGRLMNMFNKMEKGRFLAFQLYGGAFNLYRRAEGFKFYLEEHGSVVDDMICDSRVSNIDDIVMELSRKEYDGIFITNDVCGKIVQGLKTIEGYRFPIMIGFDAVDDNASELRNGYVSAIISQQPKIQGRETIMNIFTALMLEKEVDDISPIPIEILIKENSDYIS